MTGLRAWIRDNVTDAQVKALGNRMATEFDRLDRAIGVTQAEQQTAAEIREELRKGMGLPPEDGDA